MNYPLTAHINVALPMELKEWLYKEADYQMTNISAIVRQAIKLLKEKYEREEKEK